MNTSLNKNKLSLTVAITTCYGDVSIIDTVKSIRASKGVGNFKFILIADRVPISSKIKKELKKLKVSLIENATESSLVNKQKQTLTLAKTDLLVFTQDDVLFAPQTLMKVVKRFESHPKTTMISILNKPVNATNYFESILNLGTEIANKIAKYWNNGDNYLSVIGRFMAFRTDTINKFRMPDVSSVDAYYYLENKRVKGVYEYLSDVPVYFKNPQNMTEHLRKSSRFQFSRLEMSHYFEDVTDEYNVPKIVQLRGFGEQLLENPFKTTLYVLIYLYTRILKMQPKIVLDPAWDVDVSTKKVLIK